MSSAAASSFFGAALAALATGASTLGS